MVRNLDLQPGAQVFYTDHGRWVPPRSPGPRHLRGGAAPFASGSWPTGDGDAALVWTSLRPSRRTALVVLDRITSASAIRLPVDEVYRCRQQRSVLINSAHRADRRPVPAGPAFWLGNLHKWAFAARTAAAGCRPGGVGDTPTGVERRGMTLRAPSRLPQHSRIRRLTWRFRRTGLPRGTPGELHPLSAVPPSKRGSPRWRSASGAACGA